MNLSKKLVGISAASLLALGLGACGDDDANKDDAAGGGSDKPVGELVDHQIIGIDPGAGIMEATNRAIEDYNLDEWNVTTGSGASMTAALKKAYDKEEPIIITGWTPHWMFAKYDLKFLEDPEGSYGGEEEIHSIGRLGLEEDKPEAYQILENFEWEEDDMGDVMIDIIDGEDGDVAAQNWIDENEDKVAEWTDGVEDVDGEEFSFAYVSWDSAVASVSVMTKVLEDKGYEVKASQVEAGPMWTAVADGSVDATLSGWLPITHATYVEKYADKFVDIGTHSDGVKIGLAVPEYMDVDSIEDLKE